MRSADYKFFEFWHGNKAEALLLDVKSKLGFAPQMHQVQAVIRSWDSLVRAHPAVVDYRSANNYSLHLDSSRRAGKHYFSDNPKQPNTAPPYFFRVIIENDNEPNGWRAELEEFSFSLETDTNNYFDETAPPPEGSEDED